MMTGKRVIEYNPQEAIIAQVRQSLFDQDLQRVDPLLFASVLDLRRRYKERRIGDREGGIVMGNARKIMDLQRRGLVRSFAEREQEARRRLGIGLM